MNKSGIACFGVGRKSVPLDHVYPQSAAWTFDAK